MKKILSGLVALSAALLLHSLPATANDCPGGWRVMPNYQPGSGGPCQLLGLNSRAGVCQPGYEYETLCDDASGGRYKTCQGPRRCSGGNSGGYGGGWGGGGYNQPGPPPNGQCTSWDYKRNRPCPSGYVNNDCIGTCESLQAPPQRNQQQNNCYYWDFSRNQPCPPGYINRDCSGDCGRM